MKVPLPVTCPACKKQFALDVRGSDLPEYTKCPKCGTQSRNLWPLGNAVTKADQNAWDNAWKGFSSFKTQLDAVSKLLTYEAFDKFALQNKGWLLPQPDGFDPATGIKQHFQNRFYRTRTRVVHYGEVDFQKTDGERCFSLAWVLLKLFHAMERKACELLDDGKRIFNSQSAGASGATKG